MDKLDEICSELWRAIKLFHDTNFTITLMMLNIKSMKTLSMEFYPGKYEEDIGLDVVMMVDFKKRFEKTINDIQSKFENVINIKYT
ncbi:MAG: hypothetical protein U5K35_00360 [Rhodohalobacter sp.]|nr:hypothetical protein [Rhodohalobacter sp.]